VKKQKQEVLHDDEKVNENE